MWVTVGWCGVIFVWDMSLSGFGVCGSWSRCNRVRRLGIGLSILFFFSSTKFRALSEESERERERGRMFFARYRRPLVSWNISFTAHPPADATGDRKSVVEGESVDRVCALLHNTKTPTTTYVERAHVYHEVQTQ